MSKRYSVSDKTGLLGSLTGTKIAEVTDTKTGKTGSGGSFKNFSEAKESAWSDLEKKQGPAPSEK